MFAKTCCFLFAAMLFHAAAAQRHSVLIQEIFADPTPSIGLPDAEYIELRNTSPSPISLAGWRLQTASATSGAFPAYTLLPDSMVVVTGRTTAGLFGPNTLGVASFPALANSGTTLVLRNASGQSIHAVAFNTAWYRNPVKAEGGWSLELIDPRNPCGGAANWKASEAPAGGTPGLHNSVAAANADARGPSLLAATANGATQLVLTFDEPLDSAAAARARYQLQPEIAIVHAAPQAPFFDQVLLTLATNLQEGQLYTVSIAAVTDCAGNGIGSRNTVPAGLPQPPQPNDIVINELLFNPKGEGSDYVELYNRSRKVIDLSGLWLAKRTSNAFDNLQQLSATPRYLFPGAYLVTTENGEWVQNNYLIKDATTLLPVADMPTLPDDKGSLVLLNAQNGIVDELNYSDNWHFPLVSNPEGVALERIDPDKPTQDKANWTSAAASAGFGTPGYRNSQFKQVAAGSAGISITPQVVSPDGDGLDDFCTINYQLDAPNYVANLTLFDTQGHRVRYLVQNQTLAQSGNWRWDGLGDNNRRLTPGSYIMLVEFFNVQGRKQQFRQIVAIAYRK